MGVNPKEHNQYNLDNQHYGKPDGEELVLGLVAEKLHADYAADASADYGKEEEHGFGNAPLVVDGTVFVDAHGSKTEEVNRCKVCNYPYDCTVKFQSYLFFLLTSCIFMARTFVERPKRLMKPSASW